MSDEKLADGRDMAGETVMGMRVAAYREPVRCPPDCDPTEFAEIFPKGAGHRYSEHWSTPGANAERLFVEADVRTLTDRLEALSAQAPAGDGWVIVPREPTGAMIDAYFIRCRELGFTAHINASTAWEALLSALPPEGEG